MSKHTKGPWVWMEDGNLYSAPDLPPQDATRWADTGGADPIVVTDSGYYPPFDGDKPLIAAAPDLLAALRFFADPPTSEPIIWRKAQERARAAIAKAEGVEDGGEQVRSEA